jgi:phosphoadenosine phosphosulfate reductase
VRVDGGALRTEHVVPRQTVAEQDAAEGPRLYEREPGRCCALRKVERLAAALAGYDAWATGVRRADGPTRADTPMVKFDERFGLVKVNPLVAGGYPSIGCAPCTARPRPGADVRSGRRAGRAKTECGLHG